MIEPIVIGLAFIALGLIFGIGMAVLHHVLTRRTCNHTYGLTDSGRYCYRCGKKEPRS